MTLMSKEDILIKQKHTDRSYNTKRNYIDQTVISECHTKTEIDTNTTDSKLGII